MWKKDNEHLSFYFIRVWHMRTMLHMEQSFAKKSFSKCTIEHKAISHFYFNSQTVIFSSVHLFLKMYLLYRVQLRHQTPLLTLKKMTYICNHFFFLWSEIFLLLWPPACNWTTILSMNYSLKDETAIISQWSLFWLFCYRIPTLDFCTQKIFFRS